MSIQATTAAMTLRIALSMTGLVGTFRAISHRPTGMVQSKMVARSRPRHCKCSSSGPTNALAHSLRRRPIRRGRPEPPAVMHPSLGSLRTERVPQVLRDVGGREDIVSRGEELLSQLRDVEAEQTAFPLDHLARDDHRFDIGAIH